MQMTTVCHSKGAKGERVKHFDTITLTMLAIIAFGLAQATVAMAMQPSPPSKSGFVSDDKILQPVMMQSTSKDDAFGVLPASLSSQPVSLDATRANVLGAGVSTMDIMKSAGSAGELKTLCESSVPVPSAGTKLDQTASVQSYAQANSFAQNAGVIDQVAQTTGLPQVDVTLSAGKTEGTQSVEYVKTERPEHASVMRMSSYTEVHTLNQQSITGPDSTAMLTVSDGKPSAFSVDYGTGPVGDRHQEATILTNTDNSILQTTSVSEAAEQTVDYDAKGAPMRIQTQDKTDAADSSYSVSIVQTDSNGRITAMQTQKGDESTLVSFQGDYHLTVQTGTNEQATASMDDQGNWVKTTSDGKTATFEPDAALRFAIRHNQGTNSLSNYVAEHNKELF